MSTNRNGSVLFRRRLNGMALAVGFAAMLGFYSGCNSFGGGAKGPVTVPMEFRPNHSEALSGSITATDVKVHLEAITDRRDTKDEIGRNVEDATPIPIYSSGKSPAEFVHDAVEGELKNFGVELVEAPEAADRIIELELTRFFVEESNNYRAEVKSGAQVKDKGGRVLWKGQIAGEGRTFGRSLNPANYQQVLSDATRRMIGKLLENPQFKAAIER